MNDFGSGKSLRDASPQLRDDAERHARILEVVEHDSVIEGLPRFTDAIRKRLQNRLTTLANPVPAAKPGQ